MTYRKFNSDETFSYTGQWCNDERVIKEKFWDGADGSYYIGEMKDGAFHGFGTLTLKDGKQYQGTFKQGEHTGKMKFSSIANELFYYWYKKSGKVYKRRKIGKD